MDTKWFQDFLCLIDTKNFSAAADVRCVTQSAYSRRIRALEDWLGVELFDRTSMPISLTEHGEKFQPHAEKILFDLKLMQSVITPRKPQKKSNLVVSTQHTLMLHFMPDLLMNFDFEDKKIVVTSNISGFDAYYDCIAGGDSDLLIAYEVPELDNRLANASHIRRCVVGTETIVPVIASNLKHKIQWESNQKIPFLSFDSSSFLGSIINHKLRPYADRLDNVYEVNLSDGLLQMVKQGKGVAWLPLSVCKDEIERQNVSILKGPNLCTEAHIIAYINTQKADDTARNFWHYLNRAFKQQIALAS